MNIDIDTNINTNGSNILFKPKSFVEEIDENHINTHDIMNNSRSILTKSSMMTYGKIICCLCSAVIEANPSGMCTACANSQINITDHITTSGIVQYCKLCQRYSRPPWVRLKPESNDMMSFLLSKVKGLKGLKLTDSNFIWTEPHSKKIKIKITIQKEIDKIIKQSSVIIDFTEDWTQCEDCKKTFTPHLWNAACQVRQKVEHKRTFLFLEQAVLKHKMHEKALNVKETPEGIDFYFKNRSNANAFSDFIHSILPAKIKQSKQLVSHDQWSNLYNYKYTYMIEIAPVCKDDVIILNHEQYKELGGIGPLLLCYKICSNVHMLDPLTMEVLEFDENTYWRHNFRSFIDRVTLEEFVIQNVEEEVDYSKMNQSNVSITASNISSKANESKSTYHKNLKSYHQLNENGYYSKRDNHKFKIVKVDCIKKNDSKLYSFRSHLGEKMKAGDVYLGYDLQSINTSLLEIDTSNFPEIVLVKKKYIRQVNKRLWKLERMNMDKEGDEKDKQKYKKKNKDKAKDDDLNEFLEDIEEDKEIREKINLYKDEEAIKELEKQFGKMGIEEIKKIQNEEFGIDIANMIGELQINDKKEGKEGKEGEEFPVPNLSHVKAKKIKRNNNIQIEKGEEKEKEKEKNKKRDRKGSNLSSDGVFDEK